MSKPNTLLLLVSLMVAVLAVLFVRPVAASTNSSIRLYVVSAYDINYSTKIPKGFQIRAAVPCESNTMSGVRFGGSSTEHICLIGNL